MKEASRTPVDRDQILDLAHGLLPEDERADVLARIADDPEAERQLREMERARERARAGGAPKPVTAPTPWLERLKLALRNPRPATLMGFGLVVAIVVALLRGPADSPYPVLPTDLETLRLRGAEESLPAEMSEGLAAYSEGRYGAAVDLLRAVESDGPIGIVRDVYLGSALARSGRSAEALEILEDLRTGPLPDPWRRETRWTLALALLEVGRKEDARALLNRMADESGELGERARKLLETLR